MLLINTGKLLYNKKYSIIPHTTQPVDATVSFVDVTQSVAGMQQYKDFSYYFDQNIALIDRSNTIKSPFVQSTTRFQLPKKTKKQSFEQCCDSRAQQISSSSDHFYFMYGGGIDSIVALHALSKYTKNITILTTDTATNTQYYKENIVGKYKVDHISKIKSCNGVFVTGHLGDELFGTTMYNTLFSRNRDIIFDEPTQENLTFLLKRGEYVFFNEEETIKTNIALMQKIVDTSPIVVDTIHKYFWWLNFCLMWNVSYTRFMAFKESIPEKTYFPFFATDEFQNWSINNIDNRFLDKTPAKTYLNLDYLNDVCKQKRNKDYFCGFPMAYMITEDYKNLHTEDSILSLQIDDESSFSLEKI